jgi:predicted dehydrogenase
MASAFPGLRTATRLAAVLDQVDAVVVATPPNNHKAVAISAIRAGKHVLVEKPLATTLEDATEILEEARRANVILMVGHTFEFNPAVHELRNRMDAGELGEICYIHSARLNLGLYRNDVNVVWDLAPHDVSIMNYLLRSTPSSVRAWGSSHCSSVADLAYFQLEYRDRAVVGYGHVSWLDPRKVRQVTVVGDKKMAIYDDLSEERLRIFDRGVERPISQPKQHSMPTSYRYGDIVSPHLRFEEPLLLEDRHFIDCILTNTQPTSDGACGCSVVSVLGAIDRAMAGGHTVSIGA